MDITQEHNEAMSVLSSMYDTPRARAVLDWAKSLGWERFAVTCPDGSVHSPAMYTMQLYCNTSELAATDIEQNTVAQVVSVMSALEESGAFRFQNYGARVLYEMRRAGLSPSAEEYNAFMAMNPRWEHKTELFDANKLAVPFYMAKQITLYNTLPGMRGVFNQDGRPIALNAPTGDVAADIEALVNTFVPHAIGEANVSKLAAMLKALQRRSDFFSATSGGSGEETVAQHTLSVMHKLVNLTHPRTEAQVGLCVLTALIHDLADVHFAEGKDAEGNVRYRKNPPYCHEIVAQYIAGAYLGDCLPEEIAAAIDCQFSPDLTAMTYPLGLYLHLADLAAIYQITRN